MAEYPPHGSPGSMLDTTKRNPPEVTNLQPSRRGKRQGPPATQALAKLKGATKRKKTGAKKKRASLVGAARAGSVAASQPKKKRGI